MKKFFSIGEAAKAVNMTAETLRHYDRIGLVKPSKKDASTKYRYYTEQDLVRLNTVHALQQMDLPLREIKAVLEYDDLEKIVAFLEEAEQKADEKIAALQNGKRKIQLAREDYERKLSSQPSAEGIAIKYFPARVILLSDTLKTPTLDNLWNYLSHFYERVPAALKAQFSFEDLAGVYRQDGQSNLFAICTRYVEIEGLKTLPAGRYLCADCSEAQREQKTGELVRMAEEQYHAAPRFTVQQVLVSGILQWNYQIQVYIGE